MMHREGEPTDFSRELTRNSLEFTAIRQLSKAKEMGGDYFYENLQTGQEQCVINAVDRRIHIEWTKLRVRNDYIFSQRPQPSELIPGTTGLVVPVFSLKLSDDIVRNKYKLETTTGFERMDPKTGLKTSRITQIGVEPDRLDAKTIAEISNVFQENYAVSPQVTPISNELVQDVLQSLTSGALVPITRLDMNEANWAWGNNYPILPE